MKIAFTSCFDAIDDVQQIVWTRVLEKRPDVLLLLGDTVYMDFGIGLLGSKRPLGWPRKADLETFANTLYSRYSAQWAVASFRELLASGVQIGMTWDDHDFAWNDSRGAGSEKKYAVPRDKRLVSKALFTQFRDTLRQGNFDRDYPAMSPVAAMLASPEGGIQDTFDAGSVRCICLDGRSYRQDPNEVPDAEMHGRVQRDWASGLLDSWAGVKVIAAGSVLTKSKESWDQYADYLWLMNQPAEKIIVLTGDIHKNVGPVRHRKNPAIYEITSSGAARPGLGGNSGNFGLLNIGDEVTVRLFTEEDGAGAEYDLQF